MAGPDPDWPEWPGFGLHPREYFERLEEVRSLRHHEICEDQRVHCRKTYFDTRIISKRRPEEWPLQMIYSTFSCGDGPRLLWSRSLEGFYNLSELQRELLVNGGMRVIVDARGFLRDLKTRDSGSNNDSCLVSLMELFGRYLYGTADLKTTKTELDETLQICLGGREKRLIPGRNFLPRGAERMTAEEQRVLMVELYHLGCDVFVDKEPASLQRYGLLYAWALLLFIHVKLRVAYPSNVIKAEELTDSDVEIFTRECCNNEGVVTAESFYTGCMEYCVDTEADSLNLRGLTYREMSDDIFQVVVGSADRSVGAEDWKDLTRRDVIRKAILDYKPEVGLPPVFAYSDIDPTPREERVKWTGYFREEGDERGVNVFFPLPNHVNQEPGSDFDYIIL